MLEPGVQLNLSKLLMMHSVECPVCARFASVVAAACSCAAGLLILARSVVDCCLELR
jgi:hypothetical protein